MYELHRICLEATSRLTTRSGIKPLAMGTNCKDKIKHSLKPTPELFINSCWVLIWSPVFLILSFALGMNQTAIQAVNLFNFFAKSHKIHIHRHNTGKTCLKGISPWQRVIQKRLYHTSHLRSYPRTTRKLKPYRRAKYIYTRICSFLQSPGGEKRTTTEEFTIMKSNGHPPTLGGSKERVAWMENLAEQIHVPNQGYEVVPSVATFAPWRNLV